MPKFIHADGLEFREMMHFQNSHPKYSFRQNKEVYPIMCKVFAEGLNRADISESIHMRQHAYMLLLGITLDEMKTKIVPEYF